MTFNSSYEINAFQKRARACRAIGTVMGLGNVVGQNDCMQSTSPSNAGMTENQPKAISFQRIDDFYGPNVSFASSLAARADRAVNRERAASYAVSAVARGHALTELELQRDGATIATTTATPSSCTKGNCTLVAIGAPAALNLAGLAAGRHTISAVATNELGQTKTNSFVFWLDTPTWIGFHDDWHTANRQLGGNPDPGNFQLPPAFEKAEELGANTYRFTVGWNTALPCSGSPNGWTLFENAYKYATTDGSRPIVAASVGGGNDPCHGFSPEGAPDPPVPGQPKNCTGPGGGTADENDAPSAALPSSYAPKPPSTNYDAEWRAFIAELARRMPRLLGIEIWNEPNARKFWGWCNVDAVRYSQLVDQAKRGLSAAKAAHPEIARDMKIVTAGLSPGTGTSADANVRDWEQYLRTMVLIGVLASFPQPPDTGPVVEPAIGSHPYLRKSDCKNNPNFKPANALEKQIDAARAIVGTSVPIWITEVGASRGDPAITNDCRQATSFADQANQLIDIIREMRSQGVPVGILFRFATQQPGLGNPDAPEQVWFKEMGALNENFARRVGGAGLDPYCGLAAELDFMPTLIACP